MFWEAKALKVVFIPSERILRIRQPPRPHWTALAALTDTVADGQQSKKGDKYYSLTL